MNLREQEAFINKWTFFTAKTGIVLDWLNYIVECPVDEKGEASIFDIIYEFANKNNFWEEFVQFTHIYDENLKELPPYLPTLPNGITGEDIDDMAKEFDSSVRGETEQPIHEVIEEIAPLCKDKNGEVGSY